MTEEEEIRRAQQAQSILSDPLVIEAFANLEEVYLHSIRNAPIDKPEVMQVYRYRIEALDAFRQELRHILDTGNMAQLKAQLREEQEKRAGLAHRQDA